MKSKYGRLELALKICAELDGRTERVGLTELGELCGCAPNTVRNTLSVLAVVDPAIKKCISCACPGGLKARNIYDENYREVDPWVWRARQGKKPAVDEKAVIICPKCGEKMEFEG